MLGIAIDWVTGRSPHWIPRWLNVQSGPCKLGGQGKGQASMASGQRCALKRGTPRILGLVLVVGYPGAHEQGAGVRASQFPTALSCGFWVQWFFGCPGGKTYLGVVVCVAGEQNSCTPSFWRYQGSKGTPCQGSQPASGKGSSPEVHLVGDQGPRRTKWNARN